MFVNSVRFMMDVVQPGPVGYWVREITWACFMAEGWGGRGGAVLGLRVGHKISWCSGCA